MATVKSMEAVREGVVARIEHLTTAREHLIDCRIKTNVASHEIVKAWEGFPAPYAVVGTEAGALSTLMQGTIDKLREQIEQAAVQLAALVARDVIAKRVREDESGEPVVWLTSNAYVPPHRDIYECEVVWKCDREGLWEIFVEALEDKLREEEIYMACPEYDNSLYAVDKRRWEWVESAEGDSLNDEWVPIIRHD